MVASTAFAVILIAVISICVAGEIKRTRRIRGKHPPISDDEFMERLPPGTSRDTAMRVRTIVAEQFGVERDRVHPESEFTDLIE